MRFARGNVRDHIVSHKTATDLRIGAKEPCSGRDGQQTTFARFSVPFDFRLFQQYRREADIRRSVGFTYGRRLRGRPVAQGPAMSNGCTLSPPTIRGLDGSKRSCTSRFLTSERATTKASFRLLACRSATLKKALPK
jgi:hypothetical protein